MWTDSVKIQNDVAILARKDWYAVYTIVRHEKTANTMLAEKGIETYLPLREVRSRWKDRIKKIQLPLFPGYLFVCISNLPGERFNILNTQGVVRLLGTGSDPVPVLPSEIENIKVLLRSGLDFDADVFSQSGHEVLVINGPLKGVQGRIIERRGKYWLVLSVEMIQRSVVVQVDIRDVEVF